MRTKSLPILRLKSFLASPRNYMAAWRNLARETDVNRWADTRNLDPMWDERTALIAGMIPAGSSVLEFGAGQERLGKLLNANCEYQPSDVFARSDKTLICDLNAAFPKLNKKWDYIVFSGVLEYIHDLQGLLDKVRASCNACILSYAPTDGLECMTTRMRNGWVNHLSKDDFEKIIHAAKFEIKEIRSWNEQPVYSLR